MTINKNATAKWEGSIKEGKGQITLESGALKAQPYGFNTRFEGKTGTNPEELIAAAHASCFTMALSKQLGEHGFKEPQLETQAVISLDQKDGGFAITKSALTLKAHVKDISEDDFKKCAEEAKTNCPISKLLKADISLDYQLNK